jgi:hypothetical protein
MGVGGLSLFTTFMYWPQNGTLFLLTGSCIWQYTTGGSSTTNATNYLIAGQYSLASTWSPFGASSCCYPANNVISFSQTTAAGNATLALNWAPNNVWCGLFWPNTTSTYSYVGPTTGGANSFGNISYAYFSSNNTIGLFFDNCAQYYQSGEKLVLSAASIIILLTHLL